MEAAIESGSVDHGDAKTDEVVAAPSSEDAAASGQSNNLEDDDLDDLLNSELASPLLLF